MKWFVCKLTRGCSIRPPLPSSRLRVRPHPMCDVCTCINHAVTHYRGIIMCHCERQVFTRTCGGARVHSCSCVMIMRKVTLHGAARLI